MITLAVNSNLVASVHGIRIALKELLGGHEFRLNLSVSEIPVKTISRWLAIESARINVEGIGGTSYAIGVARPDAVAHVSQPNENVYTREIELALPLPGSQLRAIEAMRQDGDLTIRFVLKGTCGSHDGTEPRAPYSEEIRYTCSRSDWISQLNTSGAANVILFEVSLPGSVGAANDKPFAILREAQQHYLNGRYGDAVGKCRLVLEKLGVVAPRGPISLAKYMTQAERMELFAQVLRHTTHDPHHANPDTEQHSFTGTEARMIIQMTAVYAGHHTNA